MKRSGIRRKKPKVDLEERKRRESAEGEECTLRFFGVCNGRTDTTVYCHSNFLVDGKGTGLKAKLGCYGCDKCHDVLDGRRRTHLTYEELEAEFLRAVQETHERMDSKGVRHAELSEVRNSTQSGT